MTSLETLNKAMTEEVAADHLLTGRAVTDMSASITQVAAALVAAQADMRHASKDSINPHFKNEYAGLPQIIDVAREVLPKHKLTFIQRTLPSEKGVTLQTIVLHESGEWIADGGLYLPASKLDAQGFGSALTYARRYGLSSLLGIAQADDDGNAASGRA